MVNSLLYFILIGLIDLIMISVHCGSMLLGYWVVGFVVIRFSLAFDAIMDPFDIIMFQLQKT